MSKQDSLSNDDLRKWIANVLIFSSPSIVVFLTALQGGVDPKIALGFSLQALIAAAIDLLSKYKAGPDVTPTIVLTQSDNTYPMAPSTFVTPVKEE